MSKNTPEKFWAKIKVNGPDECWPWQGHVNSWGYGDCYYQGARTNASRIAYKLSHGSIPAGKVVCHRCDNPVCCNPSHLWADTQAANNEDCRRKGRQRYRTGTDHHRATAKLTPDQVAWAKEQYADGIPQTHIARDLGVHSSTISRAVRAEYWPEVA